MRDLIGQCFDKWTVLRKADDRIIAGKKCYYWLCECSCDKHTIKEVSEKSLIYGRSKSCGCNRAGKHVKHGMTNSRLYGIYKHMMNRCYNKNDTSYGKYGANGITVCDEWHTFDSFKEWALSNGYSDSLTLDRIDFNGNYSPDNCRWVDYVVQNRNRNCVNIIEYNGEKHTIPEWAEITNMPYKKLWKRIHVGWDIEKALTTA